MDLQTVSRAFVEGGLHELAEQFRRQARNVGMPLVQGGAGGAFRRKRSGEGSKGAKAAASRRW